MIQEDVGHLEEGHTLGNGTTTEMSAIILGGNDRYLYSIVFFKLNIF